MARRNRRAEKTAGTPETLSPDFIDFETWFSMRKDAIPSHHRKEIILADFLAREVPDMATVEQFDKALEKYGVRLV